MERIQPTREQAWELLCEFTKNENLRKHGLSVEAAMRAMARRHGEDEEAWGIVGLVHDFDYERWPSAPDHPLKGSEILAERGFPEPWIQAILGHAPHTGVARETSLARSLFAVDELCGLITAVTLVRPSKNLADVKARSVKKKMKEKAFARSVNRQEIIQGAEELGVDFDEHVQFVIAAMQPIADQLGLDGTNA